jgi:redox-sensing transcriptional repressor
MKKILRKSDSISDHTVNRLSLYLRCFTRLGDEGVKTISSHRLAGQFQLNSAQIRKDLACFGEFGVRGVGYYVDDLIDHITRILGLDRQFRIAIIGAGHLGQALADHGRFHSQGFSVSALFDNNPDKIDRTTRRGIPIIDVARCEEVLARDRISIAVLAVPGQVAQALADRLAGAGIKAILNFTPANLRLPPAVKLNTVDLTVQMENLAFFLSHPDTRG